MTLFHIESEFHLQRHAIQAAQRAITNLIDDALQPISAVMVNNYGSIFAAHSFIKRAYHLDDRHYNPQVVMDFTTGGFTPVVGLLCPPTTKLREIKRAKMSINEKIVFVPKSNLSRQCPASNLPVSLKKSTGQTPFITSHQIRKMRGWVCRWPIKRSAIHHAEHGDWRHHQHFQSTSPFLC